MAFLKLACMAALLIFCGSFVEVEGALRSLGCWKDTAKRAIPTLEGKDKGLDGHYRKRKDVINKCMRAALLRGHTVFAIQHQGWCASGPAALSTYKKYGASKACKNGRGGPWANNVYQIIRGYRSLGCWKDTAKRAIPTLEGKDKGLDGHYRKRKDVINKCLRAALARGYNVFAIQHQGWCASGPAALSTYKKYGASKACKNGRGGPWANDVYIIGAGGISSTKTTVTYTKVTYKVVKGDEPKEEEENDTMTEEDDTPAQEEDIPEEENDVIEEDEPLDEESDEDSIQE